jgi:hypothetical protein
LRAARVGTGAARHRSDALTVPRASGPYRLGALQPLHRVVVEVRDRVRAIVCCRSVGARCYCVDERVAEDARRECFKRHTECAEQLDPNVRPPTPLLANTHNLGKTTAHSYLRRARRTQRFDNCESIVCHPR